MFASNPRRTLGWSMADAEDDGRWSAGAHRHALTTLRHRNFRLIWSGQVISMTGGQIQVIANAFQIYTLTGSSLQVGLVGLFGFLPGLVFSFIGGAVADRFDRRRVLFITQTATMSTVLVLVAATAGGFISPTIIYVMAFISGSTRAFDGPSRQALIPMIVPPQELASALTLNTMARQLATIAGPGLGGVVIGLLGFTAAYAINAATFLVVIGALVVMDPLPEVRRATTRGLELALGGLRFARSEPVVLSLLSLDFLTMIIGSTRALIPAFAESILHVGVEGAGLMYSAPAAGAIAGALILGAIGSQWRHAAIVLSVTAAFGLFTIGFGFSTYYPLALVMLFGTGFVDVIGEVMRATVVQLRTPDELRGRVTAMSSMFTGGGPQLGQLQSGALASAFGPAAAAVVGGAGVVAITAAFSLNKHIWRTADPVRRPEPAERQQPELTG